RGELAGEGVLLARVVGADEDAIADRDLGPVPEPPPRPRHRRLGAAEDWRDAFPAELAEGDDDRRRVEDLELPGEERRAGIPLRDRRLVEGRRAADGGGNPGTAGGGSVVGPPPP